jgi:HPt (histidine-containing phosphotransfer) domain-containing protein
LRGALAAGDAAAVRASAHGLSGSSDYVGAQQVAKLARALESRARHGGLDDEASALVAQLADGLEATCKALLT